MSLNRFLKSGSPVEASESNGLPVLMYPKSSEYKVVTMATVASVTTVISDVSAGAAAQLVAVRVNTVIGSTAPLIYDGLTSVHSIPIDTAAGTRIDFDNNAFRNGISIHTTSVAGGSSGAFVVTYRPLLNNDA